ADEPANRRGSGKLPLKPGDWNAMTITLDRGKVALELNGSPIYERPLEPSNDRLFGFFHDKDRSSVQVRNVILSGNWPESLSADRLANLFARRDVDRGVAQRRAEHAVVGEQHITSQAARVLYGARALPADSRYEALISWVLPNDDHPTFRLQGDFPPTDA